MRNLGSLFLVLLPLFFGCRTPYEPEVPATELSILVVEGYLDTQGLKSELKLSLTVPLAAEDAFAPEQGAIVMLKNSSGQSFPLTESTPGIYLFEKDIDEQQTYVVEITLNSGERYVS